ncbi:potassium transporter [Rhodovulum sp. BSW8]|uniref:Kef-type potassium/proton antiporter (CPA2 family) n=1 Tax=Rhodovulum visakhapatnamense TaxID=364297 RepID=A0A4R8FMD5_9RHOB|nr:MULTISPECIES: cation:proton antiporter [Rhodovulum]RBO55145.1 potassium transporter [Rhodovulum sp. BSW8]TDX23381.1 Kef-type potassium/proton antiporter (CPA2 family) [Rhodovulum visakhapatnamense]
MDSFLLPALICLAAAVIAVPLAARLGLGSVLGYLAAGIAIGPALALVGAQVEDIRHVAEFGVVLMLFLIGLELEPKVLWRMRTRLVGLGGLQVTLTTLAIMAAAIPALGLGWEQALAVGLVFALSSTAIVLQTLSEKGLMPTNGGRASFSVLLAQDIAVIPMLVALPLLVAAPKARIAPDGSVVRPALEAAQPPHGAEHLSLVAGLPGWGVALVTLGAVAVVILAGHYLIRPVFRFVSMAHLREMYTALALLLVIGIAVLMGMVGLSPALGTFLAGVVLADSEFRHDLEGNIEPFKGLLLGLFFITVGAGIDFQVLLADPLGIFGLALGVMVIKGLVLAALGRLFRLKGRDRWLFTLGLAQAGEFGFVILGLAVQQDVLSERLTQTLLLVIALTMLMTPLFFFVYEMVSRRLAVAGIGPDHAPDEIDERNPILIAGIGRFGQVVQRMLQMSGFRATMLDDDLATINLMRKFGIKGFFGNPTRPETLMAAGLGTAQVFVVALDDPAATTRVVIFARRVRPDLTIIARARDRAHAYELYRAGADKIVRELFDSSLRVARYSLEAMGLSTTEARERESAYYDFDRRMVRELADLWQPGVSAEKNEGYLRRARELNGELDTALLSRTAHRRATDPATQRPARGETQADSSIAPADAPEDVADRA